MPRSNAKKAAAADQQAERQASRLHVLDSAIDQPLPTFTATTLAGRPIDTAHLAHGGVAVVWFWATWCRPCLAELPRMEALAAHYHGDTSVRFLGLSVDDDLGVVRRFLARRGVKVPIGHLASQSDADALDVDAIPMVLVIGPKGHVRYRHVGYDPSMTRELAREIDALRHAAGAQAQATPATN